MKKTQKVEPPIDEEVVNKICIDTKLAQKNGYV